MGTKLTIFGCNSKKETKKLTFGLFCHDSSKKKQPVITEKIVINCKIAYNEIAIDVSNNNYILIDIFEVCRVCRKLINHLIIRWLSAACIV